MVNDFQTKGQNIELNYENKNDMNEIQKAKYLQILDHK